MSGSFARNINRALGVERSDWPKIAKLSGYSCAGIGFSILIQAIVTSLFLAKYSASSLPYYFSLQALCYIGASSIYVYFAEKISRKRESDLLLIILAITILCSRFLFNIEGKWLVFAICIWLQTAVEVYTSHNWVVVTGSLDTRESRRLISIIGAGGTLGAVFAGIAVTWLAVTIGTENLLLLGLPLIAGSFILARIVIAEYHTAKTAPKKSGAAGGKTKRVTLQTILKDRLLVAFLVLTSSMIIASTLVDYQFRSALQETYDKDSITAFLGSFFSILNAVALVFQLFVSMRLIVILGLTFSLALMPALVMTGTALYAAVPVLWIIVCTRFVENVMKYSSYKTATGMVLCPYPPLEQSRLRIITGGIVKPAAVLLGSFLLIILSDPIGLRGIAVISALICLTGLAAALKIGKPYVDKLENSLSDRFIRLRYSGDLTLDRDALKVLERKLFSEDTPEVLSAIELATETKASIPAETLRKLMEHPDSQVRKAIIKSVRTTINRDEAAGVLLDFVNNLESPQETASCIKSLRHIGNQDSMEWIPRFLKDEQPAVLSEAVATALSAPGTDYFDAALSRLESLGHSLCEEDLALAAYVAGEAGHKDCDKVLLPLLEHENIRVRQEAIRAAAKIRTLQLIPLLAKSLEVRVLRPLAINAIALQGAKAVKPLVTLYEEQQTSPAHKAGILQALGHIHTEESASFLGEKLSESAEGLRTRALNSLTIVKRNNLSISLPKDLITSYLARMAATVQLYQAVIQAPVDQRLKNEVQLRHDRAVECVFKALGLLGNQQIIFKAWLNYIAKDKRLRANSIELIDNIIGKKLATIVVPLIEGKPLGGAGLAELQSLGVKLDTSGDWPDLLVRTGDHWLISVATHFGTNLRVEVDRSMSMQMIERILFLRGVELFSGLTAEELRPLAELFTEQAAAADSVLIQQGDTGDCFYLIQTGGVKVERDGQELARLGAGDYFGEMAVLDQEPRSATLTTTEDCELLKLDQEDFYELLQEHPELSQSIIRTLARRVRGLLENA